MPRIRPAINVQLLPDQIEVTGKLSGFTPLKGSESAPVDLNGVFSLDPSRPAGQDDHPVGHTDGFGDVMGHQEGGFPLPAKYLNHLILNGQAGLVVQGRKRFVQKQHLRVYRQGSDQGYSLPHPARKLAGEMPLEVHQAVFFEEAERPGPAFRVKEPLDFQSEQDVADHVPPFEEVILLKHVSDLPGGAMDLALPYQDVPRGWHDQAGHQGEQGALTTAARSDDGDELPFPDSQEKVFMIVTSFWGVIPLRFRVYSSTISGIPPGLPPTMVLPFT